MNTTTAQPRGAADEAAAVPAPPDDVREAARHAPDHWFGMLDPAWRARHEEEDEAPPVWAVLGQWRSDSRGEIVEWQDNTAYRPSPAMMGWPRPTDPVDAAAQLAATGYGPHEDVAVAVVQARLAVLTAPHGGPVLACAPDGTPVVPVFSQAAHLHAAGALAHQLLPAEEVFAWVPDGYELCVNPAGPAPARLSVADLENAVAALTARATGRGDT